MLLLLLSIPTKRVVVVQAEARAEFAEKTVKKLQKEVDRLEGLLSDPCSIITTHYLGVDCTTCCTRLLGNNNALLHSRRGHLDISACSYYFPQLSRRVHHFNSPPHFYFFIHMFSKFKKVILCTVFFN